MQFAGILPREDQPLAELRSYGALDTPRDQPLTGGAGHGDGKGQGYAFG